MPTYSRISFLDSSDRVAREKEEQLLTALLGLCGGKETANANDADPEIVPNGTIDFTPRHTRPHPGRKCPKISFQSLVICRVRRDRPPLHLSALRSWFAVHASRQNIAKIEACTS